MTRLGVKARASLECGRRMHARGRKSGEFEMRDSWGRMYVGNPTLAYLGTSYLTYLVGTLLNMRSWPSNAIGIVT